MLKLLLLLKARGLFTAFIMLIFIFKPISLLKGALRPFANALLALLLLSLRLISILMLNNKSTIYLNKNG